MELKGVYKDGSHKRRSSQACNVPAYMSLGWYPDTSA